MSTENVESVRRAFERYPHGPDKAARWVEEFWDADAEVSGRDADARSPD